MKVSRVTKIIIILMLYRRKIRRVRENKSVKRIIARLSLQQTLNNSLYCQQFLRMSLSTFHRLLQLIEPNIPDYFVSKAECLTVTLQFLGNNECVVSQMRTFGLSNSTIQRIKYDTINSILLSLKPLMHVNSSLWRRTLTLKGKFPELDGSIGAIDGTHIPMRTKAELTNVFRNRKGFISTNVLLCCNYTQRILFVEIGSPGSYHDSTVYKQSSLPHLMQQLPREYFLLGDAGYALSDRVLTPFRGVRYHLKEFGPACSKPRNEKEIFNLKHSRSRNVIERTIGILKRRWRILRHGNESLDFRFISNCIVACCLIHNILMDRTDLNLDPDFEPIDMEEELDEEELPPWNQEYAKNWRELIAAIMWNNYQCYIR